MDPLAAVMSSSSTCRGRRRSTRAFTRATILDCVCAIEDFSMQLPRQHTRELALALTYAYLRRDLLAHEYAIVVVLVVVCFEGVILPICCSCFSMSQQRCLLGHCHLSAREGERELLLVGRKATCEWILGWNIISGAATPILTFLTSMRGSCIAESAGCGVWGRSTG